MRRTIKLLLKIEAHEIRAAFTSFFFMFTLMVAYYTLRPVRDAMASDWSDAELSWLWTSTFLISLAAVAIYGSVISRIRFRRIVPGVYGFFSLSFLAFYLGTHIADDPVYIDKAFYVWLSVFSLFHVSVFWSFMADMFSKDQGKRLFGFIASGASIGAVAGPLFPVFFSATLGVYNLILLAAALLLLIIPLVAYLERLKQEDLHGGRAGAVDSSWITTGGNPLAGFADFFSNRYLLGIGLFILLYTGDEHVCLFRTEKHAGRIRSRNPVAILGHHGFDSQFTGRDHGHVRHQPPGLALRVERHLVDSTRHHHCRVADRGDLSAAAGADGPAGRAPRRQLCRDPARPGNALHPR